MKLLRSLRVFRLIKVWQIGLLALVLFGGCGTGLEKHKVDPKINGELFMKLRDKIFMDWLY